MNINGRSLISVFDLWLCEVIPGLNTEASVLTWQKATGTKLQVDVVLIFAKEKKKKPSSQQKVVMSNACGAELLSTEQCLLGKAVLLSLGHPSGLRITWQLRS